MDHESLIPLPLLTSSLVPTDKVQFMARPSQRRGNLLHPDVPGIVSVPNLADSHSTRPQCIDQPLRGTLTISSAHFITRSGLYSNTALAITTDKAWRLDRDRRCQGHIRATSSPSP